MTSEFIAPADGIRWRASLDEIVVLEVTTGRSWLLDPAGAAIWAAVVEAGSLPGALAHLPGADPAEVQRFVEGLVAGGTLVAGPAGG